jgi:hypothetical protein
MAAVVLLGVIIAPGMLLAGTADHCVKVEPVENKLMERMDMAIINTCPQKIYVRWCFESDKKGGCGGERFYNRSRSIKGNGQHTSKYGLPTGPAIHVAACFGKYAYVFDSDETPKNYSCDPIVRCGDGSKAYFFSHAKELDTKYTSVYISKSGGETHTFKIKKSELADHTRDPDKVMELFAKLRVCGQRDNPGFGKEAFNDVKKYMRDKLDFYGDKCANESEKSWYCPLMFEKKPKGSGSSGVQG